MKHETQWTPGPWSVGRTISRERGAYLETPVHVGERGNRGNCIALVYLGGPGAIHRDAASLEANAHLIAAAPDLYEALELMTREIVERHDITIGTMVKAHAALAKARGEA